MRLVAGYGTCDDSQRTHPDWTKISDWIDFWPIVSLDFVTKTRGLDSSAAILRPIRRVRFLFWRAGNP